MLSLAPLRYSHVTATWGGPIQRIEAGTTSVMGERLFQANAYLRDDLRGAPRDNVVYGDADGTGTSRSSSVARHIAISEALERWAHREVLRGPERDLYGFDVDKSSNGMAAFPGLLARQARQRALGEAAERFAVIAWWSGALEAHPRPSPWPGIQVWEIDNPLSSHRVVLLHAGSEDGEHAYGMAGGDTLADACQRAAGELVRAQYVLRRHIARHGVDVRVARHLFERRCLFFAAETGYRLFADRLRRQAVFRAKPEVVFDGEIPGPWAEFATVWRVAVRPAAPEFLSMKDDFFFW
jgi:hypothetical protein